MSFSSVLASGGRRKRAALLVLITLCSLIPSLASAHAFLTSSDPSGNAIVATQPAAVTIEFSERVEPSASKAELYNSAGAKVETPPSHVGSSAKELVLPLPDGLAAGTYTVQWQNVSAEDGHPNSGYFAFTIGNEANVVLPSPPPSPPSNSAIVSLGSIARWLGFLGLACIIGSLLVWHLVVVPSSAALEDPEFLRVAKRVRLLALSGSAIGIIGSALLVISQALTTGTGLGPSNLLGIIGNRTIGHLIVVRVAILAALAALMWKSQLWRPQPESRLKWPALALLIAVPIPYSLGSHAETVSGGRAAAVASDWLHIAAGSIWIGGLLTLVVGLVMIKSLPIERRQQLYATAIPRFSTLAIISIIILGITGFYASLLQIGSVTALLHTTYGHTLLIKLAALVPLLLLGAFNLLIVSPRVSRSTFFAQHFGQTVIAEVVLGVAILAVAGTLAGLPTAREVTTYSSGHPSYDLSGAGIRATLQIDPGTVGLNRYTADVQQSSKPLPAGSKVFVRISPDGQIGGIQQVDLPLMSGSKTRYTAQGSELSVVGRWKVDLVVRRPNQADWDQTISLQMSATPPVEKAPDLPLRFQGLPPALGVIIGALGIAALVIRLRRKRPSKGYGRFTAESGAWLVAASALVLFVSRAPSLPSSKGNPVPKTPDSVAAGKVVFEQNCVVCHGADGRGDGPMAASLNPPPADLHAAHVDYHTDKQIYDWIQGGIAGSAMPASKGKISEKDIWNVVNYVRSLRHPNGS